MNLTPAVLLTPNGAKTVAPNGVHTDSLKAYLERVTDDLLASLRPLNSFPPVHDAGSSPATAPCSKGTSSTG